jgi:hypothetical protein
MEQLVALAMEEGMAAALGLIERSRPNTRERRRSSPGLALDGTRRHIENAGARSRG